MIDVDVIKRRRKALARALDGGLIVLSAYQLMQQAADMTHPFRQEANFLYLTGLDEPNWHMIYDSARDKCWLVRPELSEVEVLFSGEMSAQEALQISGADEVIGVSELDAVLRQCARQHAAVYTLKTPLEQVSFVLNPAARQLTARLDRIFASVNDVTRELSDLRAVKQPEEITLINRAIAITATAFDAVRNNLSRYTYEYEIEAEFWSQFRRKNAQHAYSPIIAGGNNATVLHYDKNHARLKKRSVVLMDCGATTHGYNADITRTVAQDAPTKEQQEIHDALTEAHQQIIALIRPGFSLRGYQEESDRIMKHTLQRLGLLTRLEDETTYRQYFPHAVSHGLGLDVHESLGSSGYFQPGMVLTVEPGIYNAKKQLGFRIEDNILVTERGHQNLSKRISTALD